MTTAVVSALVVVVLALMVVLWPLASRRRDRANRLLSLGSVSSQWLLSHRQEEG